MENTSSADLRVLSFTFAATELTVEATSPAGRAFLGTLVGTCAGVLPVSLTLAKSHGDAFACRAVAAGLRFERSAAALEAFAPGWAS